MLPFLWFLKLRPSCSKHACPCPLLRSSSCSFHLLNFDRADTSSCFSSLVTGVAQTGLSQHCGLARISPPSPLNPPVAPSTFSLGIVVMASLFSFPSVPLSPAKLSAPQRRGLCLLCLLCTRALLGADCMAVVHCYLLNRDGSENLGCVVPMPGGRAGWGLP